MVRYYPQIKENDFETNTCNKKEFKKYIYKKGHNNNKSNNSNSIANLLKDKISYNELSPHQQFLVNYINPNTPYKGMLIYHETGTGKTCTAISIAENFKEDLKKKNKKINVLCAAHVAKIFKETMLEKNTSSFQCTGNTYYDEIYDRHMQQKELEKRVNDFYQFETYDNFGKEFLRNIFDIDKTDKIPKNINEEIKMTIKKKYSHSFFILDEAHNFRSNFNTSSNDKAHHKAIDFISTYADNVKILFLTATPMFDTPVEIVWILNVLIRINKDNITELDNTIFKNIQGKNYLLTNEGTKKLVRAMRGKVTYYKAGHPDNFPIKLLEESTLKFEYPKYDYDNKKISSNITESLNTINIKLTFSKMSDAHYNIINNAYINKNIIKDEYTAKDSFHTLQKQLHNVSWFNSINEYFESENKIVFETKINKDNVLKNLKKYAPKIDNMINQIIDMSSNGIAFIYSQYVDAGVKPIVLALEYNGFSKYDPENNSSHLKINKNREKREKRGNYIVITSDVAFRAKDEYINIAKSPKNASGDIIRVIVISKCANEGMDFKYIRQVHILEPDFHFSDIEQAVGRAIRTNSHKELSEEKRNCTIYYHSTVYPDHINRETIDMHLYRLSSKKKIAIREVKNLIEANSITCSFFKNVNSIDWNTLINKKMINSKNEQIIITKENLHNSSNMIECKTCSNNNDKTDHDTYNPLIHSKSQIYLAIKIISILFKNHNQFLLKDIQNYINEIDSEIDQKTLYFALNIIINSNTIIKNKFNIQGKIRKINNYYKFVPNYSMYTNIYHDTPLQLSNSYISMDSIPWLDRPSLNETNIIKEVTNKYNQYIKKKIFDVKNDFWQLKEPLKYRNNLIANVIIDELKPDKKFELFYNQKNLPTELKEAINRYRYKNNLFKHVTSITNDGGYIIVNKNKITKIKINPKKNLMSNSKRELFAYNDFDKNGNAIFLIMDSRDSNKKPTGKKCTNKKTLKNDINFLVKSHFMKYDKYVDSVYKLKDGQTEYSNNFITCDDLCLELNMIYRLLDILKNKEDSKWFYEYWDAYEYDIKSSK